MLFSRRYVSLWRISWKSGNSKVYPSFDMKKHSSWTLILLLKLECKCVKTKLTAYKFLERKWVLLSNHLNCYCKMFPAENIANLYFFAFDQVNISRMFQFFFHEIFLLKSEQKLVHKIEIMLMTANHLLVIALNFCHCFNHTGAKDYYVFLFIMFLSSLR